MKTLERLKNDFSISATIAGLIVVLVGMTSSAVIVFQAATAFGASPAQASSWLGSLCLGMGLLTVLFSYYYRAPILMAWSTPGAVLLVSGAAGFSLKEAIAAFVFSSVLTLIFGLTGWFEKLIQHISLSLTSALLAGVLLHFCLDGFSAFKSSPILVGSMFLTYLLGKKIEPRLTMLFVLLGGLLVSISLGLFHFKNVEMTPTAFEWNSPEFSIGSIFSLGIPLFIVTMASQNLTGLSVMRANHFSNPISPLISGMGFMNLLTSFFGGFTINLAAITAAIAMGPESHPNKEKRYIAALVSGFSYVVIGFFAGSITSLFAAFPEAMIPAIAGFALLGTVASSLEASLKEATEKEAAFVTFVIAASGLSFLGISSAFWAILIGVVVQLFFNWNPKSHRRSLH